MSATTYTISQVFFVKGVDGECERDYEDFPTRYSTLEDALRVVSTMPFGVYYIDDEPRGGKFPPFRGWPEDAAKRLAIQELAA